MGGPVRTLRFLFAACLLSLLAADAGRAHAEEPPQEDREAAERAFIESRPQLLEGILGTPGEDADAALRWPFQMRDAWWRPAGETPWGESEPPHWRSDGGGDPYPVLSALVADRHRRETRGHEGLPAESPLVLLAPRYDPQTHEALHYYLGENTRYWMGLAYEGYPEDDYSRRMERNSEALSARNGALAIWSLIVFVLGAIGLGWFLGRGDG